MAVEFKAGDIVKIVKPCTMVGENQQMRNARTSKIPIPITVIQFSKNVPNFRESLVYVKDNVGLGINNMYVGAGALEPWNSEKDGDAKEIEKTILERRSNVVKEFAEGICSPIVAYFRRPIDLVNTKTMLSTNANFVIVGKADKDLTKIVEGNLNNMAAACCAFTRNVRDMDIYIPKLWVRYYGYNEKDIVRWLKFLEGCEIGFTANYMGESECLNGYNKDGGRLVGFTAPFGDSLLINLKGKICSYVIDDDKFYRVMLKAGSHSNISYLHFICVRYLYNLKYWNIPVTAMQIKYKLKDKITNLQALLMAHNREAYYNYYCWSTARGDNYKTGNLLINTKGDALLKNVVSNNTLNNAMKYYNGGDFTQPYSVKLAEMWKEGKYSELFDIYSSWK